MGFNRLVHVEALKAERAMLDARPDSDTKTRRLAEVDEQLSQYGEKPNRRNRETASQNPPAAPTPSAPPTI